MENLQDTLSKALCKFSDQFPLMYFMFTHKIGDKNIVTTLIKGLPRTTSIYFNQDIDDPVIKFDASAYIPRISTKPKIGWDSVGDDITRLTRLVMKNNYFNSYSFIINRVNELSVYEYGFQILSLNGVNLFVILPPLTDEFFGTNKVQHINFEVGMSLNSPIFSENNYPCVYKWENKSEKFIDNFTVNKYFNEKSTKQIIIED